jgi:hypothetical protein
MKILYNYLYGFNILFSSKYVLGSIFSSVDIRKELLRMTDKVFRTVSNYQEELDYHIDRGCMILTDKCNSIEYCELEKVEPDYYKEILVSDKSNHFFNIRNRCDSTVSQSQLSFIWDDENIKTLDFIVYNTVLLVSDLKRNDEDGVDLREIMIDKYYSYLIQEVKKFFNISKTFHVLENAYINRPKKKQIQYNKQKNRFVVYGSSQLFEN